MSDEIIIAPMTGDFLLWRCLHGGPLAPEGIEDWSQQDASVPWQVLRERNRPLLGKLVATYGSCAMLAYAGGRVVGMLRFYPKAIAMVPEAGMLCLQQTFPAGPSEGLVAQAFPPQDEIGDRTLVVHCLMTGAPSQPQSPYQRKGIGTRLAHALAVWGQARGWEAIEATAYPDLPILYSVTGQAGRRFWEKLGYRCIATSPEPGFEEAGDLLSSMRAQAFEMGLDPDCVCVKYTMRLDLDKERGA